MVSAAPLRNLRDLSTKVRIVRTSMAEGSSSADIGPTLWRVQGVTLRELLSQVYGIDRSRIDVSAVTGVSTDVDQRFDITLPLRGSESDEAVRVALERALAAQLDLSLSFQTRLEDSYVLTAPTGASAHLIRASLGSKPVAGDMAPGEITVSGQLCPGFTSAEIWAHGATLSGLAGALEDNLDHPVIDETGLAGVYDFHIPEYRSADELFSLLQEQLGVTVTSAPREVEVLTVRPASRTPYELRQAM